MSHGYAYVSTADSTHIALSFIPNNPYYKGWEGVYHLLVPAEADDKIVGYVLHEADDTHGYLWRAAELPQATSSLEYFRSCEIMCTDRKRLCDKHWNLTPVKLGDRL